MKINSMSFSSEGLITESPALKLTAMENVNKSYLKCYVKIRFQVAVGIRPGASCEHLQNIFSEQYNNMSIIGQNSLTHEITGHLFNLWPELPET